MLFVACGGSGTPSGGPDPAIQPFVGTWDATVFTVTNDANPQQVANLLENGFFNIVVQPSGLYTGTLKYGELSPLVEIGQLSVSGSFLTLAPSNPGPCVAASAYLFSGPDHLTLDGPTCFDFNLDGEAEDAQAHIELERRVS